MTTEILLFLLKGGHINMEKRIESNIWPHPPLQLTDLINVLADYLRSNGIFPHEWIERKDGELIDDASVIERINEHVFVFRSRRAHPTNLHKLASNTEKVFNSEESVAEYYLRTTLHLPGDLDGWKVIDNTAKG